MSAALLRTVTCPTCGGPSLFAPENKWRPFCSERCKNVDFGAWASESYRVPEKPGTDASETDPSGGPREH
jgi:endogenous inhibitor of DNA gyrase (YacG/DUF329 family)